MFSGTLSTEQQSDAATPEEKEERGEERTDPHGHGAGQAGERVDGLQLRRRGGQDQLAMRPVPLHQQGEVDGEGAHRDAHRGIPPPVPLLRQNLQDAKRIEGPRDPRPQQELPDGSGPTDESNQQQFTA